MKTFKLISLQIVEDAKLVDVFLEDGLIINREDDQNSWLLEAYTDHTHLANLTYPGFDRKHLLSERWIECEKEIYQHATVNFTMSSNISASMIEDYNCDRERVACVYCGSNVQVGDDESAHVARAMSCELWAVSWAFRAGAGRRIPSSS